MHSTRSRKW